MADPVPAAYPCDNGYCTADAVFYVSALRRGDSPRVLIVGGVRARQLFTAPGASREPALCVDCTSQLVEEVGGALVAAGHVRAARAVPTEGATPDA